MNCVELEYEKSVQVAGVVVVEAVDVDEVLKTKGFEVSKERQRVLERWTLDLKFSE